MTTRGGDLAIRWAGASGGHDVPLRSRYDDGRCRARLRGRDRAPGATAPWRPRLADPGTSRRFPPPEPRLLRAERRPAGQPPDSRTRMAGARCRSASASSSRCARRRGSSRTSCTSSSASARKTTRSAEKVHRLACRLMQASGLDAVLDTRLPRPARPLRRPARRGAPVERRRARTRRRRNSARSPPRCASSSRRCPRRTAATTRSTKARRWFGEAAPHLKSFALVALRRRRALLRRAGARLRGRRSASIPRWARSTSRASASFSAARCGAS